MRRYLLFAAFGPGEGGWNDFIKDFGTPELAEQHAVQRRFDWFQVVDGAVGAQLAEGVWPKQGGEYTIMRFEN